MKKTAGGTSKLDFVPWDDPDIVYEEAIYVWGSDGLSKAKSNKKFFLKYMESHEEEIESYLKKNNFRLNRSEDLISLFDYYNSLN